MLSALYSVLCTNLVFFILGHKISHYRHSFNLYFCSLGERCDLQSGPGREVLGEVGLVDLVNGREVVDVCQEDGGLDDVVEGCSSELKMKPMLDIYND